MRAILLAIGVLLIVFWMVGFLFRYVISPLIHLALVIGLVLLAYHLLAGRRRI